MEEWPQNDTIPQTTEVALAAEVALACDILTDAEIQRADMTIFRGLTRAERLNVTMPDGSEVTALCAWSEDHVDLAAGRYDGDSWPRMRGRRVVLNPWGAPGDHVFETLQEGHNARESEVDTDDSPSPDAIGPEAALAGV